MFLNSHHCCGHNSMIFMSQFMVPVVLMQKTWWNTVIIDKTSPNCALAAISHMPAVKKLYWLLTSPDQ